MDHMLGIEIGGTKIQMIVSDQDLNILDRSHFFIGDIKDAGLIRDEIEKRLEGYISQYAFRSIGVGFGGPIDSGTGKIFKSFQVNGWEDFNLKNWLVGITGVPVIVDNDANVAALAEAHLGAGRPYVRRFYMTLGSGVGGGLVLNREIYHGRGTVEFEIGKLQLDKVGTSLESTCSGWALNKRLKNYIATHPSSPLALHASEDPANASKYLIMAIKDGDDQADLIFQEMIDNLAFGLSHVIHLLNPDVIIIGGGLSLIGDYLKESLNLRLPTYLMELLKGQLPDIKLAELGELAVPLGAIVHAQNEIKNYNL